VFSKCEEKGKKKSQHWVHLKARKSRKAKAKSEKLMKA